MTKRTHLRQKFELGWDIRRSQILRNKILREGRQRDLTGNFSTCFTTWEFYTIIIFIRLVSNE